MTINYIVVGLGNPGEEYIHTRHNVGFRVLDILARGDAWEKSDNANALYCHREIAEKRIELLKPQTFMNKSGSAVLYAQKKYDVPPERIIVVHDDIDIPFGALKVLVARNAGGHKGVESIVSALGTNTFVRIRIGIAQKTADGTPKKPHNKDGTRTFVLSEFTQTEKAKLSDILESAVNAVRMIIERGIEPAMNIYNVRS